MKRKKGLVGGALALALALGGLVFISSRRNPESPAVKPSGAAATASGTRVADSLFPRSGQKSQTNAFQRKTGAPGRVADGGAGGASSAADEGAEAEAALQTAAADQAVEAWETLIDQAAEVQDAPPTADQAQRVREAFDRLEKRDKMEALHTALNLLPDEQFLLLYGILFNKQEDTEILDEIFNDMLNRPEEIKVPMMKALMEDKSHPMYVEAVRILDVTGELDEMQDGDREEE